MEDLDLVVVLVVAGMEGHRMDLGERTNLDGMQDLVLDRTAAVVAHPSSAEA